MQSLANKKVLVMGLGRFGGGVTVAKWLVQQNAIVTVNDAEPPEKLTDSLNQLAGLPIQFKLGRHHLQDFLAQDLLIINPAVDKEKNPILQQALAAGIPYTTEINLFLQRNPALTIGITGSVGKSTTTTLIHEALEAALATPQTWISKWSENIPNQLSIQPSPTEFPQVFLGGNIGKSLLLDLPNITKNDIVILELSSFMLEDTPAIQWSPNIALITNLFPNHLDRHNTLALYAAAKQNILKFQTKNDIAILNADHDLIARWFPLAQKSGAAVLKYSARGPNPIPLLIPGEHNQSNAKAALAVLDALQSRNIPLNRQAALQAIQNFPGLAHRLQLVYTLALPSGKNLQFYNDSKATSPDASITALNAFPPRSAIFLVGGYDKHIDLSPFEKLLSQKAGAVIGLAQTGQAILNNIHAPIPLAYAGTLQAALPLATQWAAQSPNLTAVVLSPASASYGQFLNYEQRGETFITLAKNEGHHAPA